jgi:hypothetical protein
LTGKLSGHQVHGSIKDCENQFRINPHRHASYF